MFGFCRSGFEPRESYSVWRTMKARDEYGLPYVFRSWDGFNAWREDKEEYAEKVSPVVLSASQYELAEKIASASDEINAYEYEWQYVHFDAAVSAMLNGGEELQGVIDWLKEYEFEELAEEVREEVK
jgi:hypothetical protein